MDVLRCNRFDFRGLRKNILTLESSIICCILKNSLSKSRFWKFWPGGGGGQSPLPPSSYDPVMTFTETSYKTSVAAVKHNSFNKVSTLFQNMKNMFCFSKALFIALGLVYKSQSQILFLQELHLIQQGFSAVMGGNTTKYAVTFPEDKRLFRIKSNLNLCLPNLNLCLPNLNLT